MKNGAIDLSFVGHLEELRGRLLKCILAIIAASCFFYRFIDQVLEIIIKPVGKVVFISPAEAFFAVLALTFLGGAVLASPVLFYQVWSFICTGLTPTERKYIVIFGPLSFILFAMGGGFAYYAILPISLNFLFMFSSDLLVPMISVTKYISFIGALCLGFGAIFEMPLVIVFLTKIGIATPAFLIQKRRHAIVLIFIASAMLTPPDYVSQVLMAIPLIVLYEISVLLSKLTYRTKE